MAFSRTATATLLVLGSLTACSAQPAPAPGTSVPVTPSGAVSTVTPPASPPPSPSSGSTPVYSSAPKPPGIPKTPTDIIQSPGWTEGTITRGGSGPCYGMVTFDGVAYAMYSAAGPELAKGEHIRARLTPSTLDFDCGEGTPVDLGAIQRFP